VKITFQNQTVTDTENRTESIQTEKNTWGRDKIQRNKKSVNANTFGAVYESGQIPMPVGNEENNKGKSLIELQQDAGNTNVALQQDYMTLLSHTMSQEDYAKACEDGFDPRELDQDTAVTIVDRIKAELVRSGQNIAGYTDDIDLDTLAAAVGSDTLAQSIEEQFRATDIPLTPENVDELKTAWELASSLQQPQEGEVGYLVDNGLEPEIWNLYVAENSGAKVQQNTVPQELQDQMDKVITDAGLPVNDENRQKAQWLVGAGLPLTTDTLQQLAELDTIDYPVSEDAFAQLGFEIDAFGGNEYALRSVPVDLYGCSERELFLAVLDELSQETGNRGSFQVIEEKIASMSCKAAVKGNNRLSFQEAEKLIDELLTLDNPYNCPHGRPTIITMTETDLEKKFKRIV
jgi:PKD repeat protein